MARASRNVDSLDYEREALDAALLSRFLASNVLSEVDLGKLADQLFGSDKYVTANVDAVLGEPTDSVGISTPQLLYRVLKEQRDLIRSRENPSQSDIDLDDKVRERMAICLCIDDSLSKEGRLTSALKILLETQMGQSVAGPITLRWVAAIFMRLIDEFDYEKNDQFDALNKLVCLSLLSLAEHYSSPEDRWHFFHDYCRLRLLELKGRITSGDDIIQARQTWTHEISDDVQLLASVAAQNGKAHDIQFELNAYAILRLMMVSGDETTTQHATRLASETFDSEFRLTTAIEPIRRLLDTMLVVVRSRARLEWPLPDAAKALLPVLRAQHRYELHTEQLRNKLRRFRHGEDFDEVFQEHPADTQIDDAALQRRLAQLLDESRGGRRGLALSGGGFRATCFHVGVLAHLAETEDLGRLDSISCVSGGSIAGAAYAVRLRTLLAQKFDADIGRSDLIEVVKDVIDVVTGFVGSNLRMRALASPAAVLRMWLHPEYTYTARIAELLDEGLFLPLALKHPSLAGVSEAQLRVQANRNEAMTKPPGSIGRISWTQAEAPIGWPIAPWDLRDPPRGESFDFSTAPEYNASRATKCPQAVFNATSINSGSTFVFAPEAHGERRPPYAHEISSRPRIPWTSYADIVTGMYGSPERLKLSRIVSASASVPGLIPPVLLRRVQEEALHVLADGGIFDNQGVHHLIDAGCDHIFVSDAAGQLQYQAYPDVSSFSMMARANDIMMERMRELGYKSLLDSVANDPAKSVAHVHLTKELSEPPPASLFRPDNWFRRDMADVLDHEPTSFGVVRSYQDALARMRTDLDCFCELEAYSLMLDGYLQARAAMPYSATDSDDARCSAEWPFMIVEQALKTYAPTSRLSAVLDTGSNRFLRLPRLLWHTWSATALGRIRALRIGLLCGGTAVLLAALIAIARSIADNVAGPLLVLLVVGLAVSRMQASAFKRLLSKVLSGPFLLVAMLYAWVVLLIGDPIYRRIGQAQSEHGRKS